jgi:hypothetical protein
LRGGTTFRFVSKMESARGISIFPTVCQMQKVSDFSSVRERNFATTWRKILTFSFAKKKNY